MPVARLEAEASRMLDKTHFAYASGADRCALVTGAETVAIWHLSIEDLDDSHRDGAPPSLELETSRSRIEGIAFVGADRLLTVHQLGECVLWQLPGSDDDQLPAPTDGKPQDDETSASSPADEIWTGDLGLEICAFTARSNDDGFARSAAVGARTGEIVLFHLTGDAPTVALADGHATDVTQINFDPHGYRLASGGRDRRIMLWSTDDETFEPLADPAPPGGDPPSSDGSDASETTDESDTSDSSEVSPTAKGEAARQLATHRLRCLNTLEGSQGWPLAIAFSHDEQRMATTALDNALYLWEPAAEDPLVGVVNRHHNWVTEVAFSPDDTRLATGSWDSTVHLVDTQSLSPQFRFDIHTDFVSGLTFLANTERLVSTSYDGTLAVWNWRAGELERRIEAHSDWIEVLARVDDRRVFTVSSEDVIRLWDVDSGEKIAELGDASFEGFQLGRDVDFSSYVEVPDLASDELGEGREPVAAVQAVEHFDDRRRLESGGGSEQTAVGLLEDAIDDGAMPASDRALEQRGEASEEDGTAMLESKLEEAGAEPAEAPETASPADGVGDDGQVDAAFAEISDVEADREIATDQTDTDEPGMETDGPGAAEDRNLLDDDDLKSSIEDVGEAIDEKVEEDGLGVSTDLDEPEVELEDDELEADGGQPLDEAPSDAEPDGAADEPDWNIEPETDETTAPDETDGSEDGPSGVVPSPSETQKGTQRLTRDEGLGDGASPQLGEPLDASDDSTESTPGATLQGPADSVVTDESDGGGEPSGADVETDVSMDTEDVDPNSTLVGTPQQHTSEMASGGEKPSDRDLDSGTDPSPDEESDEDEDNDTATVDADALTSKLEKLREKKQGAEPDETSSRQDDPIADDETRREIHEASAAEMWEDRSEAEDTESRESTVSDQQTDAIPAGEFQLRHAFQTPHEVVRGLGSLPGSDLVATCGADGSACLWTLGGRRRLTLTSVDTALNGIAFTPDGRILAAATSGAHIHLWLLPESLQNPDSAIKHTRLDDHDAEVTGVAVAPSGKLLLSGSRDGTARIWSLVDAACMAVLDDHGGPVVDVGWGRLPVTADDDGAIRYWDEEGRPITDARGFDQITSVATHETTTCWGTAAGDIHVQTTGQPERRHAHAAAARDVAFGPEGLLVTGGADRKLFIYDVDESEPGHRLETEAPVTSVFARQNLVGAGGEDGRVYLYSRG